jgi:hypothetical protein
MDFIYEAIGEDAVKLLIDKFGGDQIYIPQYRLLKSAIKRVLIKLDDRQKRRDFYKQLCISTKYGESLYYEAVLENRKNTKRNEVLALASLIRK